MEEDCGLAGSHALLEDTGCDIIGGDERFLWEDNGACLVRGRVIGIVEISGVKEGDEHEGEQGHEEDAH